MAYAGSLMNNTPLSSISTPAMFGFANTCPDAPRGDTGSAIAIPGWGDGVWGTQLAFGYNSGSPAYRTYYGHGATVGEWTYFATATKPAVYDLPLAAGIESDGPIKYWRAQDNTVYLRGSVSKPSPGFVNNEHIGSLPVGFRPEYDLTFPAILATPSAPAVLRVNLDGSIRLVDVPNSQGNFLKFCVFFQAA